MSWDGIKRRAEDNRGESPEAILARIDENIKFLKSGAEVVRLALVEHEKDNINKFGKIDDSLNDVKRTIYMVSGGAVVLIFIIHLMWH